MLKRDPRPYQLHNLMRSTLPSQLCRGGSGCSGPCRTESNTTRMGTRVCWSPQQALCHLHPARSGQEQGRLLDAGPWLHLACRFCWACKMFLKNIHIGCQHQERGRRYIKVWVSVFSGKTGVVAARGHIPARQHSHRLPDPRRRAGSLTGRQERELFHLLSTIRERPRRWMFLTPRTVHSFPTPAGPLGASRPLTSGQGARPSGKARSVLSDSCSGAALLSRTGPQGAC